MEVPASTVHRIDDGEAFPSAEVKVLSLRPLDGACVAVIQSFSVWVIIEEDRDRISSAAGVFSWRFSTGDAFPDLQRRKSRVHMTNVIKWRWLRPTANSGEIVVCQHPWLPRQSNFLFAFNVSSVGRECRHRPWCSSEHSNNIVYHSHTAPTCLNAPHLKRTYKNRPGSDRRRSPHRPWCSSEPHPVQLFLASDSLMWLRINSLRMLLVA